MSGIAAWRDLSNNEHRYSFIGVASNFVKCSLDDVFSPATTLQPIARRRRISDAEQWRYQQPSAMPATGPVE